MIGAWVYHSQPDETAGTTNMDCREQRSHALGAYVYHTGEYEEIHELNIINK